MTGVLKQKFDCYETKISYFCLTLKFSVLKFQISKFTFSCKANAKRSKSYLKRKFKKSMFFGCNLEFACWVFPYTVYHSKLHLKPQELLHNVHKKEIQSNLVNTDTDSQEKDNMEDNIKRVNVRDNGHFTLKDGQIVWTDKSSQDSFVWHEF